MAGTPVGVALAGGGPLGAIYEIGALIALDEALKGISLSDCDVYAGVSSGAFLAAGLANGLSPKELHHRFTETEAANDPFEPEVLLRLARREYGRRLLRLPRLVAKALSDYLEAPRSRQLFELFQPLANALPAGLFDSAPLAAYLKRLSEAPGRTDDFRKLRHKLFIVATALDTAELVTFGATGFDDVPISRAVEASAALPGLFPPVKIGERYFVDGALLKTLHASAVLKEGVRLLIAINPIVPYKAPTLENQPPPPSLVEGGLVPVLSQTFRSLIYSRMKIGMERYRHEYPDADILLFEPARDDREMFFANVFSYSDRKRLCEHAYQQTRADLFRRAPKLEPVLERHGMALDMEVLKDQERRLGGAGTTGDPLSMAIQNLERALDKLEPLIAGAQSAA
jgi:predicted acylesterase/phospholipase RssA